ncbi:Growth arrest and DNA damage-inducible 45 [Carabus blaptoides fortunei]
MCVSKTNGEKCEQLAKTAKGGVLRGVLACARAERRLICGLLSSAELLENDPYAALFCVVAETKPGDATSHMHAVLLHAYCYENDIPVIQVDSAEKLTHYCGLPARSSEIIDCALVVRHEDTSWENPCQSEGEKTLDDEIVQQDVEQWMTDDDDLENDFMSDDQIVQTVIETETLAEESEDEKQEEKVSHEDGKMALQLAAMYIEQQDESTAADVMFIKKWTDIVIRKTIAKKKQKT